MLAYTDRHFRWVLRQLSRRPLLYSEMITTGALLHGDAEGLLAHDAAERPLALQLGGDVPQELARCAKMAAAAGYDEINLNVGCPSDRVQHGNFGACLMARPEVVGECLAAMQEAVEVPVTIKHRIGIDGRESYDDLADFVRIVSDHGCRIFIVHARIAILGGLTPKQNRSVPPLRYEDVYRLKRDFPSLTVELNGGVGSLEQVSLHREHVDGVMIGRAAIDAPFLLADADRCLYGEAAVGPTRREVLERVVPYLEGHLQRGGHPHHVLRHLSGLFAHRGGNRHWRRALSGPVQHAADPLQALHALIGEMDPAILDEPADVGLMPRDRGRLAT